MIYLIVGLIATLIGSMTGLGGGIIIKPLLSMFSDKSALYINFMSASAVLVMAIINTTKSYQAKNLHYFKGLEWLIIGAMLGGNAGSTLFSLCVTSLADNQVLDLQAVLLLLTLVTLFILNKLGQLIHIKKTKFNMFVCGFLMSVISSFLGIGGGPVNMYIFTLVLGYELKVSVVLSLVTILFCQLSSLYTMFDKVTFSLDYGFDLLIICSSAVVGAMIGGYLFKRIDEKFVSKLFNGALLFVAVINILILFS